MGAGAAAPQPSLEDSVVETVELALADSGAPGSPSGCPWAGAVEGERRVWSIRCDGNQVVRCLL